MAASTVRSSALDGGAIRTENKPSFDPENTAAVQGQMALNRRLFSDAQFDRAAIPTLVFCLRIRFLRYSSQVVGEFNNE
jgi:hypothetical protein